MHADVEQRAASGRRLLGERPPRRDAQPAHRVRFGMVDLAEHAGIDDALERARPRIVAIELRGHQDLARLACPVEHLMRLLHRRRERLFAEDVRSCFQRADRNLAMERVRQADADDVRLFLLQHLPPVAVDGLDRKPVGELLGYLGVEVADRRDWLPHALIARQVHDSGREPRPDNRDL